MALTPFFNRMCQAVNVASTVPRITQRSRPASLHSVYLRSRPTTYRNPAFDIRTFQLRLASSSTPPPPNPKPSLSPSPSGRRPRPQRSRLYRFARAFLVLTAIGITGWQLDERYNASAITRSLRTGWTGLVITVDYKWNFNPKKADQIEQLHERVANRLYNTIETNQGLYIKMGQAIGLQAALLPKPYRQAFANIFDAAPNVPFPEIALIFKQDFGVDSPLRIFKTFDEIPIASASIAQVHLATIDRHDSYGRKWEEKVAVKVQKPAISKQMEWDLWSYQSLLYLTEKLFNVPMYFVAEYVSEQMRLETDFLNEARNAQKCRELLKETPELREKVYVPKVYDEVISGTRIMVMEYVDGCKLTDKDAIEKMGFSPKETMDTAIAAFSAMAFSWGFVHCDPHPGNILVRPHPKDPSRPQVVLIDHGLYITLSEKFRREYCTLWRSLFTLDIPSIEAIAREWGIALDPNMFASAILLRPFRVTATEAQKATTAATATAEGKVEQQKSDYDQQVELKGRIIHMLENEQLVPRELIFITRGHRMFQANNQVIGSPSPRINITAKWAAKGYSDIISHDKSRSLHTIGLRAWLRDRLNVLLFRGALFALDLTFWTIRVKQWWHKGTKKGERGWEDQLQEQFEKMAKDEFGIDLQDDVFVG